MLTPMMPCDLTGPQWQHPKEFNPAFVILSPITYRFHDSYATSSTLREEKVKLNWCSNIKYYNTRLTQKSPVRQQNARFDTKMPSPACTSWQCHYQTPVRNIFFQFYSNILFLGTNREMKMKVYWFEFKISIFNIIYSWKLKCNHSFLFVMAIIFAAINKNYRYSRIFCQFLHFLSIAPLKTWHAYT